MGNHYPSDARILKYGKVPKFAQIPKEVWMDERLEGGDIRVFACLAAFCIEGPSCSLGRHKIAALTAMSDKTVQSALDRLVAAGHVEIPKRAKVRDRRIFLLTHAMFKRKQGREEGWKFNEDGTKSATSIDKRRRGMGREAS